MFILFYCLGCVVISGLILFYCYLITPKWIKVLQKKPKAFKTVLLKCQTYSGKWVVTEGHRVDEDRYYSHNYKFIQNVRSWIDLPK